jgi:hypothetical protein
MRLILLTALGLTVSFSSVAGIPDDAAIVFAKCDGVLEHASMDSVNEMFTRDNYSHASAALKGASLMIDETMTLNKYYEHKSDGIDWYYSHKDREKSLDFLMYICSRAAQDAMIYVNARS